MREPWMAVYDFIYIDEKIIGGVEKNLPAVGEIIKYVEKKATGKITSQLSMASSQAALSDTGMDDQSRSQLGMSDKGSALNASALSGVQEEEEHQQKFVTVPEPFNLTKPKPKMIPLPQAIKREVKANPVPKNLNKTSLADIDKEKKSRRQATIDAIRKEYENNEKQRFALATEKLPGSQQYEKLKEEREKELTKEHKFSGIKAKPAPDFTKNEAVVKLNAAALKREKHLIDVQEREAAEKLAQMEMGLKDTSEFTRWQREMEQKDDIEKIEHVLKKKIEMELAREQAIMAQENKVKENHELANEMKAKAEKLMEEREQNIKEDYEKRKGVIEAVHTQKHKAAEAIAAKVQENRELHDKINHELEEAAKRLADEQKAEQARKEELIRQIREIEKIPVQRTQGFDPTEAGNHGLMIECSVAELRERLELNKRKLQQEIDLKREQNLAKKEREAVVLIEDAQKIEEARKKRKVQASQRREQEEKQAAIREAARVAAREKGLLEVYEKISTKKKIKKDEEERLAKELKEIKLQR